MSKRILTAALLFGVTLAARAEEPLPACDSSGAAALGEGPVATAGFYEADFATGRRACPRTEVGLRERAGMALHLADFFATLGAHTHLFGSYALDPRTELFGTLEVLRFQFVQNATLKVTSLSLGQLTAGATRVVYQEGPLAVAPSARLMLPTSTLGVATLGVELGAAADLRLAERLNLHGYAGADVSLGLSAAAAQPLAGALLSLGFQYTPWNWFAVVVDVDAHLGSRAPVDYLAPAVALRFAIWRGLGVELGGAFPLLGADPHTAAGALRLSYRP